MKQLILSISIVLLFFGCEKSIKYKYSEKPILVNCKGADQKLLNEALHSFFNDLTTYYGSKLNGGTEEVTISEAYANFIFKGAKGEVDYKNIVSTHSFKLLEKLKKEKELFRNDSKDSRLNYYSDFVSCLIDNIENEDMKTTINALKDTHSLNPKLMDERLRVSAQNALNQPNFIMYVALDTYYQYILNLDISKNDINE